MAVKKLIIKQEITIETQSDSSDTETQRLIQTSVEQVREIFRDELQQIIGDNKKPKNRKLKNKYIEIDKVAKMLNVPRFKVHTLINGNKIPHIRKGNKILFEHGKIQEWIKENNNVKNEGDIIGNHPITKTAS